MAEHLESHTHVGVGIPMASTDLVSHLADLALGMERAGEPAAARQLYQAALAAADAHLGTQSEASFRALRAIARIHVKAGELPQASMWARQILSRTTQPRHMRAAKRIMALEDQRTQSSGSGTPTGSPSSFSPQPIEPIVSFADIGGLVDAKEQIRRLGILPLGDPETAARYGIEAGGGILLSGPPGCGKTLIAQAAAHEMGVPFLAVDASDIQHPLMGMSERNLAATFEAARVAAPSVLFFDEIDAMTQSRTKDLYGGYRSLSNQFLAEMDGVVKNKGVLVLGATNAPELVDQALKRPGRFDRCIYVGKPDVMSREAIWRISSRRHPAVAFLGFSLLAELSEGLTGADIAGIMREAAEQVWVQSMGESELRDIEMTDVLLVLSRSHIDGKLKRRIEEYVTSTWSDSLREGW